MLAPDPKDPVVLTQNCHPVCNLIRTPVGQQFGFQIIDDGLTGRIINPICRFSRIFFQVKELTGLTVVKVQFPGTPSDHALVDALFRKRATCTGAVEAKFRERHIVPLGPFRGPQQGKQVPSSRMG